MICMLLTINKLNLDLTKGTNIMTLKTDPTSILNELNPNIIISGLKGDFNLQVKYYDKIIKYCESFESKSNVYIFFKCIRFFYKLSHHMRKTKLFLKVYMEDLIFILKINYLE